MFEHTLMTLAQAAPSAEQAPIKPNVPPPSVPLTPNAPTDQTATSTTASPGPAANKQPQSSPDFTFLYILLIVGVFWFVVMGGQRREKKKRAAMLEAIKKGDKVLTIGGMIGTIVEMRDNEVILKVDESSNTRIKFTRSAIQGVVEEKAGQAE